jgi:AAA+ superfamily predicted ATPase
MTPFIEKFLEYRHAGFPILYVQTYEEQRLIGEFTDLFAEEDWGDAIYHWSSVLGLALIGSEAPAERESNALKVLERVLTLPSGSVVVLKDAPLSPLTRYLRDILGHLEGTNKTLVFVSPGVSIPMELEKDVTLLEYTLPSRDQLRAILGKMVLEQEAEHRITIDITMGARVAGMASGLTANEAKNAFALALGRHGKLDDAAARTVLTEKAGALKKSRLLEWIESDQSLTKLGGFGAVKEYLKMIAPVFWKPDDALKFGLRSEDFPRSILFTGPPGTGKSMAAQLIANHLGIGCVRTDFGTIFSTGGGRVGAAEENIVRRNELVEAMAPVEDFWDELEKGMAGASGQSTQNPWEARVAGTLLTWFEMHRAQVLVVATVNKQEILAPEMLSRFQKVYFVDLPTVTERMEIFESQIADRPVVKVTKRDLELLAMKTEKFSGREIRNSIQQACRIGYAMGDRAVNVERVIEGIAAITPVARIRKGEIERLQEWALENNVEWASSASDNPHATKVEKPRQIKIRNGK